MTKKKARFKPSYKNCKKYAPECLVREAEPGKMDACMVCPARYPNEWDIPTKIKWPEDYK